MSDIAIRVEHVSKEYRLGMIGGTTLKADLQRLGAKIFRKEDPNAKIGIDASRIGERFLALDDVSFEVKKGEALGIIGHNGAGKSTLLKLLARVTAPTKGTISYNGRIASMLEVGTGFHGELTGRENIYMNGAILGMRKAEIDRKLDEIVAFAEMEKFIDTPVKRYSSGMYVKLAFAVAAHLDAEIMIMDEVLAVGDMKFQQKCLGRMNDAAQNEGRTVLFVSHNLAAVRQLCSKGLLLERGKAVRQGQIGAVIDAYRIARNEVNYHDITAAPRLGTCSSRMRFTGIEFLDENHRPAVPVTGKTVIIRMKIQTNDVLLPNCRCGVSITNMLYPVCLFANEASRAESIDLHPGECLECIVPRFPFIGGNYHIGLFCEVNGVIADWIKEIPFTVLDAPFWNTARNVPNGCDSDKHPLIEHFWNITQDSAV